MARDDKLYTVESNKFASGKDFISMDISGEKELINMFNKLPDKVARKVMRSAMRAGGNAIKKQAIANAPVRQPEQLSGGGSVSRLKRVTKGSNKRRPPGFLKKNIILAIGKSKDVWSVVYKLGTSRAAWYGMYQEFGTRHQAARPFLRPAFEGKKGVALQRIKKSLWKGIVRETTKLRKMKNG